MLFTSYEFIAFLAVVFALYYLLPKAWQWPLLLVTSLFFYWCADPMYLIFVAVTATSTYFVSRAMEKVNADQKAYLQAHKAELSKEEKKAYKSKMKAKKWHLLLFCLLLNLGILSVTKYTNFVISNINSFLSGTSKLSLVDMIVPMGISFYTFQTMGYIIDVYRDKQPAQKNYFKLLLFVTFFPQMVQGPISRYGDLSKTLYEPHAFERKTVSYGLMRILWGYFKKMVIADRIVTGVITLIGGEQYTGAYVFVAMLFYAFQLYCDFTGGIDITIGIAEVMGIRLAENFNLPYFSKNIKEYWNRWHITMGTWFTDYIFYPISVCKPMLKLSKWSREHLGPAVGKRVTVYLSSFAVWLTTGIWHGASFESPCAGSAGGVVLCGRDCHSGSAYRQVAYSLAHRVGGICSSPDAHIQGQYPGFRCRSAADPEQYGPSGRLDPDAGRECERNRRGDNPEHRKSAELGQYDNHDSAIYIGEQPVQELERHDGKRWQKGGQDDPSRNHSDGGIRHACRKSHGTRPGTHKQHP